MHFPDGIKWSLIYSKWMLNIKKSVYNMTTPWGAPLQNLTIITYDSIHSRCQNRIISFFLYNNLRPHITLWLETLVHYSVTTMSVCVLRTQQPSVESAVEGHVSSQNHMQSCWQDPNHVRASSLRTTVQMTMFVMESLYVTFMHRHTVYMYIGGFIQANTHKMQVSDRSLRHIHNILRRRIQQVI